MSGIRPPRLARSLVAIATERDQRPWLLGDLDELYASKRATHGVWRAASGTGGKSSARSLPCSAAACAGEPRTIPRM